MALPEVVLPQPDSPTRASVRPACSWKLMPATASKCRGPRCQSGARSAKRTRRSCTSSSGPSACGRGAGSTLAATASRGNASRGSLCSRQRTWCCGPASLKAGGVLAQCTIAWSQRGAKRQPANCSQSGGTVLGDAVDRLAALLNLAATLVSDSRSVLAEIQTARTEFLAGLDVLRNASQATPSILDELALADGQWVFFDWALQKPPTAGKTGRDVLMASENLLVVMDRVTGLYAAQTP